MCGCSSSRGTRLTPSTWPPWAPWPSAAQQSSFYGYTGMLPKRYTQGVMTGESTAGVMVSLSRILTKLLLPDEQAGTLIFFLVSAGLELLCLLLHLLVRRSRFVRQHTLRPRDCRPGVGAGYRVHHDVAAEDIHFEDRGPAPAGSASPKGSPAHEVVIRGRGAYVRFDVPRPRAERSWPSFRALLLHRYVVARVIWADMLSIAVTYFITLCLFPGLESEIRHCVLGEWLPILIMAVFNLSDFVGKRHAHPPPPGLALRLLPAHGHQQRLLRQRAHDPGGRQSGPAAAGAGREHHDRVLHDGADAGLRRGLLHLQPHPRRPPELPPGLRRQRLLPRRSLSRSAGPALPREGPRDPHRGPPGPEAPSPPQPAVPASPGRLRASDATLSGSGRPHCSPRAPPALRGLGHVTVPHPGALPSTVLCVSSHAQASPSVCVQGSVGATHSHPHSEEWTANQCPCGDPHCQVSTEGPGPQPPRPQPLTEPLLPWGPSRRTACPSLPTAQL
ncbi:equilibrative nucleoside transporter 4 isoform X5 [Phyllostomus hastatus]|uniref:equilibrative nucleoside transporter 4 isoform X5 n=1 Tax=Phyllostomus hastatus TaxID=9423 RepID=UPI001E6813FC|nr:equilibrative nucleoside transporter 4 isoform X5 [Phyllostomus hastatus]